MGDPVGAARHVRETLAPDGTWMIVEPDAGDRVEDNLNPVGRAYYGFSTLLCTPGSLSQDVGLALGAQAGEARIARGRHRGRVHPLPPRRRDAVQHRLRGATVTARIVVLALAFWAAAGTNPAMAIVPLGQFGAGRGDAAGLLFGPDAAAVDPVGRVYVAENNRISVFTPRGDFLRAFGRDVVPGNGSTGFEQCTTVCKAGEEGTAKGELDIPTGLAVDSEGLVHVVDSANNRVSVFDQQGAFVRTFGKNVDAGGGTGPEICDRTEACQAGEADGVAGALRQPSGLTIDSAGVLWVADSGNHRVALYTHDGRFLRAFGRGVNPTLGGRTDVCTTRCRASVPGSDAGALLSPVASAIDAAGNVYVTELADHRVSVFSPDLAFVRAFGVDVVPGNQQTGFEVCSTASGCKRGSNGAVFGRPGTRRNLAGVLNQPAGVVIGANGRLFVSEAGGDRISVFSRAPAFLRAFGKDVVPDNAETGFEECTSVCAAGRGGAGSGELDGPVLMTVDCRGALYVAEALNGRVQKFGRAGTADSPCGGAAALAKPFGIMKVRRNPRSGTATLTIRVPWSSELQLRGRGSSPSPSRSSSGAPRA